jgi:hypothetical protein
MGSKGWVAGKGPGPHKSCRPSVCSTDTLSALACQSPTGASEVSCSMGIHAPRTTCKAMRAARMHRELSQPPQQRSFIACAAAARKRERILPSARGESTA